MAISAFCEMAEAAGPSMRPLLAECVRTLAAALGAYQTRARLVLFDAVAVLASRVRLEPFADTHEVRDILLPAVFERWRLADDSHETVFPLCEMTGALATSLGPRFAAYAPHCYARALAMVERALGASQSDDCAVNAGDNTLSACGPGSPNLEFAVCGLDFIESLASALGRDFEGVAGGCGGGERG